ncbi:hypothetical protein ACFSC6_11055 [Rufibacter sediminis]|uniref:Uncharacterized protein n=1 Tax=Rufibacter sediminis TaxID=2762756 RepID=A0ABR6VTE8_9BACT|nr:hypothetical protein [Rufibacter sediminis]MBC3540419.1 hypothetical protein [Rufibacter sediminis]
MKVKEKEYLPVLKYIQILSEKAIPVSLESISNALAYSAFDARCDDKGQWHVAKHELLKRVREHGKKVPPVEEGYVTLQAYVYLLNEAGIDMPEDRVWAQIIYGNMIGKNDEFGRFLISRQDLDKAIERFGK